MGRTTCTVRIDMNEATPIDHLKSAFLTAAYGKLAPGLLKYSARLNGGHHVEATIVVEETISDDDLETVLEILGDVVGHLGGTAEFDLHKLRGADLIDSVPDLPIKLFRAFG